MDRGSAATGRTDEGGEGSDGDVRDEEDKYLVNLIWKDREPSVPHPRENPMEAIEGCNRPDVGWMRTGIRGVMVCTKRCGIRMRGMENIGDPMRWYAGEYLDIRPGKPISDLCQQRLVSSQILPSAHPRLSSLYTVHLGSTKLSCHISDNNRTW